MDLNDLMRRFVDELAAELPAPLDLSLNVGAVWCDLARLAGEAPPAQVAGIALDEPIIPTVGRGERAART